MENFNHILLFKTNLEDGSKELLKSLLGKEAGVEEWNVDLSDEDRVLRIISTTLSHQYIIQLIKNNGYECCELI